MQSPPQSHRKQSASKMPDRTPGGLVLPLRMTLTGRVRWQTLDERGVPEVPRNPSGFAIGPIEGVEQPNLITNLGMNGIVTSDLHELSPGSAASWRRYLAVGTGSVEPAFGDDTLVNEVQRAASNGGFGNGIVTFGLDLTTDPDTFWCISRVNRVVTMTADRNLTEFALGNQTVLISEDPDIYWLEAYIRELLRDENGTPITVSLLTDKKLYVQHSADIRIDAPAAGKATTVDLDKYDAGNNFVSSTPYDLTYGPAVGNFAQTNYERLFWLVLNPYGGSTRMTDMDDDSAVYDRGLQGRSSRTPNLSAEPQVYVPGTHERLYRATFSSAEGNGPWYGYAFRSGANIGARVEFLFDEPASFTKLDTETVRVGALLSWARA